MKAFPGNGDNVSVSSWGELWAPVATSGVVGDPSSTELQAYRTAGVGLFVRPGDAWVCGSYFQVEAADGDQQVTVAQNSSGSTRLDRLVLRRNPSVGGGDPALTYLTGTASAAPALSFDPLGNFDVALALTQVPTGSNVPSTVTDDRAFIGVDVVPCRVVADVPAGRRRFGTIAVESSTGLIRRWDGTAWASLSVDGHSHVTSSAGFGRGTSSMSFDATGTCRFTHDLGWAPLMLFFQPRLTDAPGGVTVHMSTSPAVTTTQVTVVAKDADGRYTGSLAQVDWLAVRN